MRLCKFTERCNELLRARRIEGEVRENGGVGIGTACVGMGFYSIVKGTQHTAYWSYGSKMAKRN